MERHDVIVIGGGPAGLSAARRLRELGVKDVLVLEREAEAGGIPRHCGHSGFGWQSHRRNWTGPRFAAELRKSVSGIDVRSGTSVLELKKDGVISARNHAGHLDLRARAVLIATGARETPRAQRFVGGTRPRGVMNAGALQQHVYLKHHKPFERPVIVGSEWVSFSVLLTCRHMGIRPVAMIEQNARIAVPRPGAWVSKLWYRVPVMTNAKLVAVEGVRQVEAVEVERHGKRERIACDGVVFTGGFRPENALYMTGTFDSEELSPKVDQGFRCTDPAYFAAGNVLGPLKTSGVCWLQGRAAAEAIARSLA
ncbi:MAG: FAD-dependent oxidoreductase [Rhizobiales bacterium]|nr:FAD-dependent oxidoreductase [Hyphomicrobiales bacterium]